MTSEQKIVDACVAINGVLADAELTNSQVGQVLERLAATLCMNHQEPLVAAMAFSWNIQKFVEINLKRKVKSEYMETD